MDKIKKILAVVSSVAVAGSCVFGSFALESDNALISSGLTTTVYGDVDHDGYVATKDAILVMKHSLNMQKIEDTNLTAAQMSTAGLTLSDAIKIMKIAVSGSTVRVTGVTVSASSKTLEIGKTFTLTASVKPSNATNIYFSFTSSNTSVATVDAAGKVTAKSAGTATITAKSVDGGYTATCKVTVSAPQPSGTITYNGVQYKVCDNYSSSYFYDQCDYSKFNEGSTNVGCSATAEAIGASMYYGKKIAPDDSKIIWTAWGAGFGLADVRYYNMSTTDKLKIAYTQLQKGNPTIINTLSSSDHWVTIVGVKTSANSSNLQASDFLIVNPWGGTLWNLGSYLSSTGRYIPYSYSIRAYE